MNPLQAISTVALGVAGLVLVIRSMLRTRRPALAGRLDPYLGALGPRESGLLGSGPAPSGLAALVVPIVAGLGVRLHAILGSIDVEARLATSGWPVTVADFRAGQVAWGLGGFAAGLVFAVVLAAAGRTVSPLAAMAAATTGAVGGVLWRERALDRAGARRRQAIVAELPTIVDLVCLAVTAGESLRGALEVVARSGGGPLGTEIRAALRDARAGVPLADALVGVARRVDVAPLHRFVDAVVAAQQRGIPLADALQSLAAEVRDAHKRDLLEAAGRKQVSMLIPVVALVLPVAIVFAFFPGVVALRMVTR